MPLAGRPELNRRLLRVRDLIDRQYAEALDVDALARAAYMSRAHFIRSFRGAFGETPHRYLQRRRVERAMALMRETELSVTEVCLEVGFTSLGSFSRTFREIVGVGPAAYRARPIPPDRHRAPSCIQRAWDRPASARLPT